MNTKKKKKPKDHLIKSVLDDLKNETADPSIRTSETKATAFGEAFLNGGKDNDYTGSVENDYEDPTKVGEAPEGLSATQIFNSGSSKPVNQDNDKTEVLGQKKSAESISHNDKTAVISSTPAEPKFEPVQMPASAPSRPSTPPQRASAFEAQFLQAENLKIAQQRIIELEKDIERLRKENEILSSANDIGKQKLEDLVATVQQSERQKFELKETNESELRIFKDGLNAKDQEIQRLKTKVEELESRLANDLRKIRVRERELENRLELSKMEKTALVRSKDETILELKRRSETMDGEIQSYQNKVIELNQKIEANQEQFSRTVRALRIALTNLEVNENTSSITLAPLKKAD